MAPTQTPPGSSRLALSQEYFNSRMRDDEALDCFVNRVRKLQVRLGYDDDCTKKSSVDFWLTRLSPRVLERLKEDLDGNLEFRTVPLLFRAVRRIEFFDRVELARKYHGMRMRDAGETFDEFVDRLTELERELGYRAGSPDDAVERRLVDGWLVRLPPALLGRLGEKSHVLVRVDRERHLLRCLKDMSHEDGSHAEQSDESGSDDAQTVKEEGSETEGQEDDEDSKEEESDSDEDGESGEDGGLRQGSNSDSSSSSSSESSSEDDKPHNEGCSWKTPFSRLHVSANGLQKGSSSSSDSSSDSSSSDSSSSSNESESADDSDDTTSNDQTQARKQEPAAQNNTNKRKRVTSEKDKGNRASQQRNARQYKRQRPNPPESATSDDSSSVNSVQQKVMKWVERVKDARHPRDRVGRRRRDRKGRFCAGA